MAPPSSSKKIYTTYVVFQNWNTLPFLKKIGPSCDGPTLSNSCEKGRGLSISQREIAWCILPPKQREFPLLDCITNKGDQPPMFIPFQMREAKAFPPRPIGPAPLETIRRERGSECGDHSPSYGIHGYIFYIINGTRRFCQPEGRSASPEISPAGLDAPGKAKKTPLRRTW